MEFKYKAFISYRHVPRDSAAAKALHTAIERYVIPKEQRTDGKMHLGKVFRDEEELGVTHDLPETICEALDETEYLIVICSPDSAQSRWVRREITHFLSNHPREKLLTVVTGGKPEEILPVIVPECPEPLYIDLSAGNTKEMLRILKDRFLKLCAPLVGCDYDDLVMREQKRKRRQMMLWISGIAAVASVIIGILSWSNWQINERNQEILLRESEILTQEALEALAVQDYYAAAEYAIAALPSADEDRPYYAPAEQALHSALDLFGNRSETMIPQDVVLEQMSPIAQFFICADGAHLVTADHYTVLNCFDTCTGQLIWSTKLDETAHYTDIQLFPCQPHGSLIVYYDKTIISLDLKTGVVLWSQRYDDLDDRLEMSDDGQYLATLSCGGPHSPLYLTLISTETGQIPCTVLIADANVNDPSIDYDFIYTNDYDFSPDGRFFAGAYLVDSSEALREEVYFITDLTTGETRDLFRSSSGFSLTNLALADDGSSLTIVRKKQINNYYKAHLAKYDFDTDALLWERCLGTENSQTAAPFIDDPVAVFLDDHILTYYDDILYLLDTVTGNTLDSLKFYSEIVLIEPLTADRFAVIERDGSFNIGTVGKYISLFSLSSSSSFNLKATEQVELWGGGVFSLAEQPILSSRLSIGPNTQGFTAFVPMNNECTVLISRADIRPYNINNRTILTQKNGDYYLSSDLCASDTLAVRHKPNGSDYEIALLNRETLEQTGSINTNSIISSWPTLTLPDKTGCICHYGEFEIFTYLYANIGLYDAVTSTYTDLVNCDASDLSAGREYVLARSCRLNDSYDILTVCVETDRLDLWCNGKALPSARYPEELDLSDDELPLPVISPNGYVLIDPLQDRQVSSAGYYWLYSVAHKEWFQIPFMPNDIKSHVLCIGSTLDLFTVLDADGLLRCYDITSGKQTLEVATDIVTDSVIHMQWIIDDRYLAIYANDGQLSVLDGATGEIVYQDGFGSSLDFIPRFAADAQREHLYVWSASGMCIDIESWTKLANIPYMVLYDPVSDCIFQTTPVSGAPDIEQLSVCSFPTTEELVDFGRAYLGE